MFTSVSHKREIETLFGIRNNLFSLRGGYVRLGRLFQVRLGQASMYFIHYVTKRRLAKQTWRCVLGREGLQSGKLKKTCLRHGNLFFYHFLFISRNILVKQGCGLSKGAGVTHINTVIFVPQPIFGLSIFHRNKLLACIS